MKNARRDHANNIDDELELFPLISAGEEREAGEELDHDAAHAPHVDGLGVGEDAEHDLGGSVEPALDVGVHDLLVQRPAAEVRYHDPALVLLLQQDVLWLQVAVDDAQCLHVLESTHELDGEPSNESLLEAGIVVHLYEFIEIQAEQVECHAQMVPEDKVVLDLDHALLILGVVLLREEEEFRLNGRLVVVLLLILNEFHSHNLLRLVVETFEDLAESALANLLDNLEPEANLVILRDPVVAVSVIVAVVDDPLGLGGVDLVLVGGEVEYFFELLNLGGLGFR